MSFIEWKESYNIGIPKADEDHRHLIGLINGLHEAMRRYSGRDTMDAAIGELEAMTSVIDEMLEYGAHHFSMEEKYMEKFAYPEHDEHERAHREFADKVQTFRREFDQGNAMSSMEIFRFLEDWVDRHLLDVDKKLGGFLKERGVTHLEREPAESRT